MRICFVLDFPISNMGGVVTSTISQVQALNQAGHTVYILGDQKINGAINLPLKPSLTLRVPGTPFTLPCYYNSAQRRKKIQELLLDNDIDCVWLQSEFTLACITQDVARSINNPVLLTVHSIFWQIKKVPLSRVAALFMRYIIRMYCRRRVSLHRKTTGTLIERTLKSLTLSVAASADAVVSPSRHQYRTLYALNSSLPLYHIPNPFFPQATTAPHTIDSLPPDNKLRITWIGRCTPEKRPLEFLTALAQCPSKHMHCTMVGDGALLNDMRKQYNQLPHVDIVGSRNNTAVISAIDQSHIVALSSYHFDNQPMVIAEAICRYRPVLYCDERLTSEGLQKAGILTDDPSPEAIAQSIKKLINHPTQLITLSHAAVEAKKIFTPKYYASTATSLIEELCQKP